MSDALAVINQFNILGFIGRKEYKTEHVARTLTNNNCPPDKDIANRFYCYILACIGRHNFKNVCKATT